MPLRRVKKQTKRSKRKRTQTRKQRAGFFAAPLFFPFPVGAGFPPLPPIHTRLPSAGAPPRPSAPVQTREIEKFIPKKDTNAPKEVNGVPLIIYRTLNTTKVPIGMYNAIHETANFLPEFDHHFYTDEDCLNFIEENFPTDVVKAFKCLKPGAFRADLWRYCILYKLGGVYTDAKIVFKLNPIGVMKEYPVCYLQDTPGGQKMCDTKHPGIWNGIMWTPPNNKVLLATIEEIVENCKSKRHGFNSLDITGPCVLGRQIAKLMGPDIITNSPFVHKSPKIYHYKDKILAIEYPKYRDEKSAFQKESYGPMWDRRDVFKDF